MIFDLWICRKHLQYTAVQRCVLGMPLCYKPIGFIQQFFYCYCKFVKVDWF
jgi:hypothetical protein